MSLALIYSLISIYGQFACKHISVKYCEKGNETNPSPDFGHDQPRLSNFTNEIDQFTGNPVRLFLEVT